MSSNDWNMMVDEDADDPEPVSSSSNEVEGAAQSATEGNKKDEMEVTKEVQPTTASKDKEEAVKKDSVVETINIDDDDDVPVPSSKRRLGDSLNVETVIDLAEDISGNSKCVNVSCKGNASLRKCPEMCLSYYRVRSKSSKHEICDVCYEEALYHYDHTADLLMKQEILFENNLPAHRELLTVSDSEEEEGEENMTVESVNYFINNFVDVFSDLYQKYDVKSQVESNVEYLKKKVENVKESVDEVDTMYSSIQKRLDTMRSDFYRPFHVPNKSVPSIEIIDDPSVPKPITRITQQQQQQEAARKKLERRSSRNVGKSISYSELENDNAKAPSPASTTSETEEPEVTSTVIEAVFPILPPKGALQRPCPQVGEHFFAGKMLTLTAWNKASILEIFAPGNVINDKVINRVTYRIKLENKQKVGINRFVCGQELAYITPSPVRLEVGTRVIALFKDTSVTSKKEAYFPGIVAEPILESNSFRYLIFFDDGYAQYVTHQNVHVIIESNKNVWEDVHMDSRQFIRKYLESYPERPMVKLQQGQIVRTEWNGKWLVASVLKVEGSLVQMYFEADARSEWIYRGSTRLNPMFKEELAASNRLEKKRAFSKINTPQKNMPYVEYTRTDSLQQATEKSDESSALQPQLRSVAKKSTAAQRDNNRGSQPPIVAPFLPPQAPNPPSSKVVYFKPRSIKKPTKFIPHKCSPKCNDEYTYQLHKLNGYNPLSKPILCGWNRLLVKIKSKKTVQYKAPCGRVVRNVQELHMYLRMTESNFTVDLFDFDHWVQCLAEFVMDKCHYSVKDISNGLEEVAIPLINYMNRDQNTFLNYSTQRRPQKGVNLNLDPEFLTGCDCEDDCSDKSKCQCWQLTLDGQRSILKDVDPEHIGYHYKRLLEQVNTGIYECNSRCKCKNTCLNRVVQHPLQLKLQVFQTTNRGWGIRCLNDVPQGTFICIYAGSLLTDQMANEGGQTYGDEYLAELDYIEVVEKLKEDYEDEAYKSDQDGSVKSDRDDDDFDPRMELDQVDDTEFRYFVQDKLEHREPSTRTRHQKKSIDKLEKEFSSKASLKENEKDNPKNENPIEEKMPIIIKQETLEEEMPKEQKSKEENPKKKQEDNGDSDTVLISDDEDVVREPSSFNPKSDTMDEDAKPRRYKSVRELFGEDESIYIMDAKNSGNIGRYLNHSCNPNVFVQNVFVDTHDLRFPWVAFFALTYIRAGTELTWNYNYDVGSVPDKVMYCHCGSIDCRGRLL